MLPYTALANPTLALCTLRHVRALHAPIEGQSVRTETAFIGIVYLVVSSQIQCLQVYLFLSSLPSNLLLGLIIVQFCLVKKLVCRHAAI